LFVEEDDEMGLGMHENEDENERQRVIVVLPTPAPFVGSRIRRSWIYFVYIFEFLVGICRDVRME
jgi:hypothetical protein